MRIVPNLLWIASGCLLLSCSKPTPPASAKVVATVAGRAITLADFQAELQRRANGRPEAFTRPAEREALLLEMIRRESVYACAKAEGFDQSPALCRQLHDLVVDRYLEERLRKASAPVAASETEIQLFYEEHGKEYDLPEQVRFAVIEFGVSRKATREKQAELLQKAESVLELARKEASAQLSFGPLAQRYSEDQATRYMGGDAGWLAKTQSTRWNAAVTDAALALRHPGELAPVVKTERAFYLVKLMERKAAGRRPLSDVQAAIAYQLEVAKRQQTEARFFEQMRSGQTIEINRVLLESLEPKVSQTEFKPPGTPAS